MQSSWNTPSTTNVPALPTADVMIGKKNAMRMLKIHMITFATEVPWSTSSGGKSCEAITKNSGPGPLSKPRMNSSRPMIATVLSPLREKETTSTTEPTSITASAMRKIFRRDMQSTIAMKMNTVTMFHTPTTKICATSG